MQNEPASKLCSVRKSSARTALRMGAVQYLVPQSRESVTLITVPCDLRHGSVSSNPCSYSSDCEPSRVQALGDGTLASSLEITCDVPTG